MTFRKLEKMVYALCLSSANPTPNPGKPSIEPAHSRYQKLFVEWIYEYIKVLTLI